MKKLFTLFIALSFVCTMQAQKFGYVNSQQLLIESPDVKAADAQLTTYQNELIAKGETMVKNFEANYKKYVEIANGGTLSKVEMAQKEGDLAKEQQAIQQYEVEVQQKLASKRETLYQPIIDKMKTMLDQIGTEMGYTMIFDSSAGGLLHAVEADDVMPLLKQKLGM
jgi:outer membrane protein